MTNTYAQNIPSNINNDIAVMQMPSTNLSDYKVTDASGSDFSKLMTNAANAKAQNTQTKFVDKAVKSNTSSINKKALNKETKEVNSNEEKEISNNENDKFKEYKNENNKTDKLREQSIERSAQNESSVNQNKNEPENNIDENEVVEITQENIQSNQNVIKNNKNEKTDKETSINKNETLLNDIDYSSFVDPSPVFSSNETTQMQNVEDMPFSSDETAILSGNMTGEISHKENNIQKDVLPSEVVKESDSAIESISNLQNNSDLSQENNIMNALKDIQNALESSKTDLSSEASEFKNLLDDIIKNADSNSTVSDNSIDFTGNAQKNAAFDADDLISDSEILNLSDSDISALNELVNNNKISKETADTILKFLNSNTGDEISELSLNGLNLQKGQFLNDFKKDNSLKTADLNKIIENPQANKNDILQETDINYEINNDAPNTTDIDINTNTDADNINEYTIKETQTDAKTSIADMVDDINIDFDGFSSLEDSGALSVFDEVAKINLQETGSVSSSAPVGNVIYDSASGNGFMVNALNNFKLNPENIQTVQTQNTFGSNLENADILNQITDKMSDIQNSASKKMTLTLRPYDLGRLHIELMTNKDGLTTNILAQNDDVRNYIEKNITTLKQQLSDAGINVNTIQIKTAGQEGSTKYDGGYNQNQQENNQNLNQQNNNHNQNNRQNDAYKSEYQMYSAQLNYDFNFVNDFSSVLSKTLSYGLN